MPATIYDAIRIDPAVKFAADGTTVNSYKATVLSKIEPVTIENAVAGEIRIGDTFNGIAITDIGKTSSQFTYNNGTSTLSQSGYYLTLSTGETFVFALDGTSLPAIVGLDVIAESAGVSGLSNIPVAAVDDDEFVQIACFTEGSPIATPDGDRAVEDLCVGDYVATLDAGAQPVRWIGHSRVLGNGPACPVRIPAGALGNRRALAVSPQHRFLWSGWRAELFFGTHEVLIKARHLVRWNGIHWDRGRGIVGYWHLMLDHHRLLNNSGAWSESFQPGSAPPLSMDVEMRAAYQSAAVPSAPSARRTLQRFEAQLLLSTVGDADPAIAA